MPKGFLTAIVWGLIVLAVAIGFWLWWSQQGGWQP